MTGPLQRQGAGRAGGAGGLGATGGGAQSLPEPDAAQQQQSAQVVAAVRAAIDAEGGWLRFDRYMDLVLHAPGLGYYAAGSAKFGQAGDFITAPELSPLFGQALATPIAAWMAVSSPQILELGAGTGALAAHILAELERLGSLPDTYAILEPSADLQQRQQARLAATVPHLVSRVRWLDRLPDRIDGVVLGNEVLDALPVRLWRWDEQASGAKVLERGVVWCDVGIDGSDHDNADGGTGGDPAAAGHLAWQERPADADLQTWVEGLHAAVAQQLGPWPASYLSERHEAAEGLTRSLVDRIGRGVLLWIDYGFPDLEFYHPQRAQGTLVAHYRHRMHDDPFWWPGLNDLTAHVPFDSIAMAALQADAVVLGYATQARFLLGCGLLDKLARTSAEDVLRYAPQAAAVQKLLSEAEMGELFKVLAVCRGFDPQAGDLPAALGFQRVGG